MLTLSCLTVEAKKLLVSGSNDRELLQGSCLNSDAAAKRRSENFADGMLRWNDDSACDDELRHL